MQSPYKFPQKQQKLRDLMVILMRHFQIIDMPSYGHLRTVNDLVRYTWIVRIHLEPVVLQLTAKLLVELVDTLQLHEVTVEYLSSIILAFNQII